MAACRDLLQHQFDVRRACSKSVYNEGVAGMWWCHTLNSPLLVYGHISPNFSLYSGYAFDGSLLKSDAKLANEFRSHKQFMTSYMRGWDLMTRGQGLTDEKG